MLTYDYENMRIIHRTREYAYVWRFKSIGEWKEFNDMFLKIAPVGVMQ
jgi:hypothetical protein